MFQLVFSYASNVALGTTLVQTENISTTIGWIAMKFCTEVDGPQRDPTSFADPLTFPLAPP